MKSVLLEERRNSVSHLAAQPGAKHIKQPLSSLGLLDVLILHS